MRSLPKIFLVKSCNEFETDLVLYAYGKIGTEERAGIEAHLDGCASCRNRQDELLRELATAPLDFPPPQFWEEYSTQMRRKLAIVDEQKQKTLTWRKPFGLGGLTVLAASLVVVIALGMTLKDSIFSTGDESQEDAMMQVLPIVQNLEFFESMHYLEMMDQEPDRNIKSSDARKQHGVWATWTRETSENELVERPIGSRYSLSAKDGDELSTALRRSACIGNGCISRRPNVV